MIALYQIVSPLPINVFDAVEVRVILVIDLANDASIAVRLVGNNRDRPMQAYALNRLAQKGPGSLRIASRGETEVTIWPLASMARQR